MTCFDHQNPAVATVTFRWEQTSVGPVCADCGVLWPGHPLPDPEPGRNPGLGALADQPSWTSRVSAMVHDLQEAS